jgi:hypothetical protein
MINPRLCQLTAVEGRRVSIGFGDGSRIDDCQLVSSGCNRVGSLWVFTNGTDVFVPCDAVVEVWETPEGSLRAA